MMRKLIWFMEDEALVDSRRTMLLIAVSALAGITALALGWPPIVAALLASFAIGITAGLAAVFALSLIFSGRRRL